MSIWIIGFLAIRYQKGLLLTGMGIWSLTYYFFQSLFGRLAADGNPRRAGPVYGRLEVGQILNIFKKLSYALPMN